LKVISVEAELKALKSITDGTPETQSFLMGRINDDHFGYSHCKDIFYRIKAFAADSKPIPTAALLAVDVALQESTSTLMNNKIEPIEFEKAQVMVDTLDTYRKLRILASSLGGAAKALKGEDAKDIDGITEKVLDDLARVKTNDQAKIYHARNTTGVLENILTGEVALVPTGYKAFDSENGGFPNGQVVILGANPGGGKSVLAMQLAINQYKMGYNTLIVSLEMDEEEMWQRVYSNITGILHDKFVNKSLTDQQKDEVRKYAKRFKNHGKKNNCNFGILPLKGDMKFSEMIYALKHKKIDILYIDYLSLIKPENDKLQKHEQLAEITRLGKKAAVSMGIPIVFLSQINKEDEAKYSGAINENSGLTLIWRYDEESAKLGNLELRVTKARNQKKIQFTLKEEFEKMRIVHSDEADMKKAEQDSVKVDPTLKFEGIDNEADY
jgi:replicative DNA helicase